MAKSAEVSFLATRHPELPQRHPAKVTGNFAAHITSFTKVPVTNVFLSSLPQCHPEAKPKDLTGNPKPKNLLYTVFVL